MRSISASSSPWPNWPVSARTRPACLLLAHAAGDGVEHGHGRIEGRLLLDVGDLDALLHDQQAIVEFRAAGNDFQQRGLAGAVAADETDALAGLDGEVGVVEQRDVAESQLRGGEGNDSHDRVRQ
jgi:hypothetical protein